MKQQKNKAASLVLAALVVTGISVPSLAAYGAAGTGDTMSLKSRNTLKYQSAAGAVALYGEDMELLADKILTMPDRAFSPDIYTHIHAWEYININAQTHTKHCAVCGSENDMTNRHTAAGRETCSISYHGNTYNGNRYTCECGYQWSRENAHNYVYTCLNDTDHSVACALDGTEYCAGFTSYEEAHLYEGAVAEDDNLHHTLTCAWCGYEKAEECDYTDHYEINENTAEIIWYCICGNYIIEPYVDEGTGIGTDAENAAGTETVGDTGEDTQTGNPEAGSTEAENISGNSLGQ